MADADAATACPPSPSAPRPSSTSSPQPPSPPPPPDPTSSPAVAAAETPTSGTPATAAAETPTFSDTPSTAAAETPAFSDADATAAAEILDDEETNPSAAKKHKTLLPPPPPAKKPKKKSNNVWTKSTSRKGKKKPKQLPAPGASGAGGDAATPDDTVLITPAPRFAADRSDDAPGAPILLSRVYKAEKVELSDDRLTAGSTKGYRMVRATRGVTAGAWYFEIKVARLGATGHTRLGWATDKGDLQAPVGYDGHSFGYRDIDGSKVHKALREKYGNEGYGEGDVIGFYINLPDGQLYAPKPPLLVWYKGQRYVYPADGKDEPPKVVPGSEISFFKNGICQGTAFTDLFGGQYYPAASMYTLPNQPNCEVRFNFGPDFEFFPQDFGGRPIPQPMSDVPYHGYEQKHDGPAENGVAEKASYEKAS